MTVSVASWNSSLSGAFQLKTAIKYPTLPFQIHCSNRFKFRKPSSVRLMPKKITTGKIEHTFCASHDVKCCLYAGRNHQHLSGDDDEQPFFIYLMKLSRVMRAVKTVLSFLAEQPSQLKYIEWPSIQSTLKTAILALILVGLFIIALSSVDSALCFILALLSRRAA